MRHDQLTKYFVPLQELRVRLGPLNYTKQKKKVNTYFIHKYLEKNLTYENNFISN